MYRFRNGKRKFLEGNFSTNETVATAAVLLFRVVKTSSLIYEGFSLKMSSSPADPYLFVFNVFAIICWIALALFSLVHRDVRFHLLHFMVHTLVFPLILSLVYAAVFIRSEVGPKNGNEGSVGFFYIEHIQNIFSDDFTCLLGWVHYLAFDLFVGHIICANAKSISMPLVVLWPCLALACYLGPVGYVVYICARFFWVRSKHGNSQHFSWVMHLPEFPTPSKRLGGEEDIERESSSYGSALSKSPMHKELVPVTDIEKELEKANKRIEKLMKANRKLGMYHERLNAVRPSNFLTTPPLRNSVQQSDKNDLEDSAVAEQKRNYNSINSLLQATAGRNEKPQKNKSFIDVPSQFPYDSAASRDEKDKVNQSICTELRRIIQYNAVCENGADGELSLSARLAKNPNEILLLLDAPSLATTNSIMANFPKLHKCAHQIVIPQADVLQYFQMVNRTVPNGLDDTYIGLQAQRLDYWLASNDRVGFKTILMYGDFETSFVGNKDVSPASDVQRWFRSGYPSKPASLLVLTFKERPPRGHPVSIVNDFVVHEGRLNNYTVKILHTWKKSLTTVMYEVAPV